MYVLDVNDLLVQTLRTNMPNPHGSGQWIYIGYPREDATFPRISVVNTGGNLNAIGVGEKIELPNGEYGYLARLDYDIDVWVKVDNRAVFNNETYVGTKLRDYLGQEVIKVLTSKKEEIKSDHPEIIDIQITNIADLPLDEVLMLHRKTISISVTFVWVRG